MQYVATSLICPFGASIPNKVYIILANQLNMTEGKKSSEVYVDHLEQFAEFRQNSVFFFYCVIPAKSHVKTSSNSYMLTTWNSLESLSRVLRKITLNYPQKILCFPKHVSLGKRTAPMIIQLTQSYSQTF